MRAPIPGGGDPRAQATRSRATRVLAGEVPRGAPGTAATQPPPHRPGSFPAARSQHFDRSSWPGLPATPGVRASVQPDRTEESYSVLGSRYASWPTECTDLRVDGCPWPRGWCRGHASGAGWAVALRGRPGPPQASTTGLSRVPEPGDLHPNAVAALQEDRGLSREADARGRSGDHNVARQESVILAVRNATR